MAEKMNSKIILCQGIKLDKDYINVLNYSESDMVSLCETQKIAELDDCSFVRDRGMIVAGFTYQQAVLGNYIAFQNPDYSNKWFFAFLDKVEYNSESSTKLYYTVDAWSTWHDYWTAKYCYIEREHVTDDTIGANLNPEPVNLGKAYVVENETFDSYSSQNFATIVSGGTDGQEFTRPARLYNGVLSGLNLTVVKSATADNLNNEIESYVEAGTSDRLLRVLQFPSRLGGFSSIINMYTNTLEFTRPTTVDGYSPKNNKLFIYPFKKIELMATSGDSVELQYELFSEFKIKVDGSIMPNVSMKAYPLNYRGLSQDLTKAVNLDCEIEVAWTGNAFKEWLARNSVTEAIKGIGMLGSALSGNVAGVATEGVGMINDFYQAQKSSSGVHGSSKSVGLNIAENNLGFRILQQSIKASVAREIDDYFTKYGYQVNCIKLPNLDTRPYFNYIKIGSDDSIGYGTVPNSYMNEINNACRRGTTIWKDHIHLGNYAVDNSING